jgi:hypothetical protein
MSRLYIRFPESLTLWTAYPFCEELQKLGAADEIAFDFSRTRTVEPFGMLVVSSEIERCMKAHPEAKFTCLGYDHMSYAGHMGFFKSFGTDFGREPGEAAGSRTYLPLTYFDTDVLQRRAAMSGRDIGDEVETESRSLAETISEANDGDVYETLSYSIREVMRNVLEHAQVDKFGICAQYWPTKGRAEVAIVDRGIGLRKSLSPNPHIDASTDKSAINYALMPAVSGKAFKGARRIVNRGPWTNSGFGLYMTSRICRNGGNFFVASGDTGMLLTSGKEGKRYIGTSLCGTAVRLSIRTEHIESLRHQLEKFRNDGYEIQKRYREIVSIDPSSASLMLSQDFDLSLWDKLLAKLKGK